VEPAEEEVGDVSAGVASFATSGGRQQSIIGDLQEQYGRGRSVFWYWQQAITTILVGDAMKQRLLWLLVPTLVTAALTTTLSYYYMPARYQSETLILVVPQQVPEAYVKSTVTIHIEDRLQTITQQILSRTRLERIISDFNLYPERRKTATLEDVVELMRSSIGIDVVKGDSFRVRFVTDDPRTAMRVTERLASLFIMENLRDREVLAEGTSQFLGSQIEEVRRQIVEKEAQLRGLRASTSGELSQGDVLPYEVLKDSYKALLQKELDARVGANLERRQIGEQYKILDPARVPEAPMGPSKTAVNLGGTLVGLAFGVVMVGVGSRQKKKSRCPSAREWVFLSRRYAGSSRGSRFSRAPVNAQRRATMAWGTRPCRSRPPTASNYAGGGSGIRRLGRAFCTSTETAGTSRCGRPSSPASRFVGTRCSRSTIADTDSAPAVRRNRGCTGTSTLSSVDSRRTRQGIDACIGGDRSVSRWPRTLPRSTARRD
jgi:hypothetical protein